MVSVRVHVFLHGGNGLDLVRDCSRLRRIFQCIFGFVLDTFNFFFDDDILSSVDYFVIRLLVLSVLVLVFHPVASLDNGLSLTPPVGWLSWERFGTEPTIRVILYI